MVEFGTPCAGLAGDAHQSRAILAAFERARLKRLLLR